MKTISIILLGLIVATIDILADGANQQATTPVPPPTAYSMIDQGANHRVWQRQVFERAPDGRIVSRPHQFTELASGMNYQDAQGNWVPSQEIIEPSAQGAVAQQGQYQVIFANNLNTAGAIDMHTPDGKELRSNILGLGYYDSSTGQAVLIAQIQDSYGALTADNQVMYSDAFDGVKADVQYTYRKGGFEQDVILREQPPTPDTFGMNPATTQLEVFTEFLNPPTATITDTMDDTGAMLDENISWGATQIGHGKAFDQTGQTDGTAVSVEKQYITVQGRNVLIEIVPLRAVANSLSQLPQQSSINKKKSLMYAKSEAGIIPVALKNEAKPTPVRPQPMKFASITPKAKGYVLDYITLDVSLTNYTFQGDTTYLVSGNTYLSGTTTIEGGAVIKYDVNNACSLNVLGTINCKTAPFEPAVFTSANDGTAGEDLGGGSACSGTLALNVQNDWGEDLQYVWIYDPNWNLVVDGEGQPEITSGNSANYSFTTGLGAPCYFYAYDGDWKEFGGQFNPLLNNGAIEVGSDGSVNYSETGSALCTPQISAAIGLTLVNGGSLHDVRFKNFALGIDCLANISVTDAQFVNCQQAFKTEGATLYAGNILMGGVGIGFAGQSFIAHAEHLTYDQGTHLTDTPSGMTYSSSLTLTNSLVTGVADMGNVPTTTNYVAWLATNTAVYQAVGAGSYYLATNSPYHNAGTAAVNSWLISDLARRTTYPPFVYSNITISVPTTFSPQARRDNAGAPDLGYHYYPLDYVFGGVMSYSNLTFSAGTSVGWFEMSGSYYGGVCGLGLDSGVTAAFNGTASSPCSFGQCNTVLEGANGVWVDHGGWPGGIVGMGHNDPANAPVLTANFTVFHHLSYEASLLRDGSSQLAVQLNNSEIWGTYGGYNVYIKCTNFLQVRCGFWQGTADSAYSFETYRDEYVNCTFYGGSVEFAHWEGAPYWQVLVRNCAFDGVSVNLDPAEGNWTWLTSDYNATNTADTYGYIAFPGSDNLAPSGGFNWQTSWLGGFYLPTGSSLIDHGNTNANLIGFYHFTTQTNQVKEANTTVDIGYHYVAVNSNGNPIDINGDGIPDYLEDPNGNGVVDAGETNWSLAITSQPTNRSAVVGDDVFFTVGATGLTPISYQWNFNGTAITGATNATLEIDGVLTNNAGNYYVTASNTVGSLTSHTVTLTVTWPGVFPVENYTVVLGSLTNFTFLGDTTYYVNSTVQLYGTTKIEGGTVIKYGNHPTSQLVLHGPLQCLSVAYHPAILTSRDDDFSGFAINHHTGNPTNNYNANYLVDAGSQTNDYRCLRIKYAGIGISGINPINVWDSQFIQCGTAVANSAGGAIALHNILISKATNCVSTTGAAAAEFLTADQCQSFCPVSATGINLTNSILTAVTNTNGVAMAASVVLSSGAGVYQSVGGGNYYLVTNTCHGQALTNINPLVLADVARKTTWPPLLLTNTIITDTILGPQASRDTGTPDLGYHYDPLDYLAACVISNSLVTLTNGVAIGYIYSDWTGGGGFLLQSGKSFVSTGDAIHRNYIVHYSMAQEAAGPVWSVYNNNPVNSERNTVPVNIYHSDTSHNPSINFQFTSVVIPQRNIYILNCADWGSGNLRLDSLTLRNCEIYSGNGDVTLYGCSSYIFENNLFAYVYFDLEDTGTVYSHNNLFVGDMTDNHYAFFYDYGAPANTWTNQNNVFDGCDTYMDDLVGYNGYLNGANIEIGVQTGDVVTNLSWVSGPLGNYYQPVNSPLVNAGRTTADQFGLYHFTTQTNQVKETNSVVDIGYHYVATDESGNPVDSYWLGVPDYLSDMDGSLGTWLMNYFGHLGVDPNADPDADGLSNLQEFLAGNNPLSATMVLAWGDNTFGECNVPVGLTNVIAVAGNGDGDPTITSAFSVALKADGTLIAWGDNTYGQTNIPTSLNDVAAIAAGSYHGLALCTNGAVVPWGCWETYSNNQFLYPTATVPSGMSNIVGVAAGLLHDVALRSDGTVVAWGADTNAACVQVPTNLPLAKAVAAGWFYSAALLTNGTLTVWGTSWPILGSPTNVISISGAPFDILALKADGTVVDINFGANPVLNYPGISNIVSIADGYWPGLALNNNGSVLVLSNSISLPAYPLEQIKAIGAGWKHALAVRGGLLTPFITGQPTDQIAAQGTNASFAVQALGFAKTAYQWQFNGVNLFGATNSMLILSNVQNTANGSYRCIVSNPAGALTSSNALLTVVLPPVIQSRSLPAVTNSIFQSNLTLNVVSTGIGYTNNFHWKFNGVNIAGAQTNVYTISNAYPSTAGTYAVVVSNIAGTTNVIWQVGVIHPGGILIYQQPTNQYQIAGGSVTFAVAAISTNALTYQWQFNGTNLPSATNAALVLTNVQSANNGAYDVVVNDGANSLASSNASFTLVTSPAITLQSTPTNLVCIYGNSLILSVGAAAPGMTNGFPLHYQWQFNGTNITRATSTNYNLIVNDTNAGIYSVVVTNAVGSTNASWQVTVTNVINVTNDLLLIYNSNSSDSSNLCAYYLAHRPMVGGANVLSVACDVGEFTTSNNCDAQIVAPVLNWLTNNPAKRPQYVILFYDIPTRLTTNSWPYPDYGSVGYHLHILRPDWQPFVNYINATNLVDCEAYVDKIARFGSNYSPGQLIISASGGGGYANTNFVLDNVRHGVGFGDNGYTSSGDVLLNIIPAITNANFNTGIDYIDGVETTNIPFLPHITNATNVAGYMCWGGHSNWGTTNLDDGDFPLDGNAQWNGNSGWWIIKTFESYNGRRHLESGQSNYEKWFSSTAFGGTNYSNTPVGACSNTEEPHLEGADTISTYFTYWASGKNFGICAWNAVNTTYFQVVGDPFVAR